MRHQEATLQYRIIILTCQAAGQGDNFLFNIPIYPNDASNSWWQAIGLVSNGTQFALQIPYTLSHQVVGAPGVLNIYPNTGDTNQFLEISGNTAISFSSVGIDSGGAIASLYYDTDTNGERYIDEDDCNWLIVQGNGNSYNAPSTEDMASIINLCDSNSRFTWGCSETNWNNFAYASAISTDVRVGEMTLIVNADNYAEVNYDSDDFSGVAIKYFAPDGHLYDTSTNLVLSSDIPFDRPWYTYKMPSDVSNGGLDGGYIKNIFQYNPWTIPTYMDTYRLYNYLPAKLPGGDYVGQPPAPNTLPGSFPLTLSAYCDVDSQPSQTADQCRWNWRTANYVRQLYVAQKWPDRYSDYNYSDDEIYKVPAILFSSVDATAYAMSDNDYNLALYLDIYTCTITDTNDADMAGPYYAGVTALNIYEDKSSSMGGSTPWLAYNTASLSPINNAITAPSFGINGGNTFFLYTNLSGIITALNDSTNRTDWPLFNCTDQGGQQMGLAACGMGSTAEFMITSDYNAYTLYDLNMSAAEAAVPLQDFTDYVDRIQTAKDNIGGEVATDNDIMVKNICDAYFIAYQRGTGFWSYSVLQLMKLDDLIDPTTYPTYANILGPNAYLTNVRIRGINIAMEDELSFGIPDTVGQPLAESNCYENHTGSFNVGSGYVPTYFPIHAIPDAGWGAVTMEIFTYQGIAAVVRNDYEGFCRWHRMYYYLLFVQNGGDMWSWSSTADDPDNEDYDAVTSTIQVTVDYDTQPTWVPDYLDASDDAKSYNMQWTNGGDNKLKNYTVYDADTQGAAGNYWPQDGTDTDADTWTEEAKTAMWANRYDPYRGGGNSIGGDDDGPNLRNQWSRPCYLVGYSPVWVSGGLNNDFTTGTEDYWGDNTTPSATATYPATVDQNKPIWEVLNPYFSSELGLYTASDADHNAFTAYKMADLKWGHNNPILDVSNVVQPDGSIISHPMMSTTEYWQDLYDACWRV